MSKKKPKEFIKTVLLLADILKGYQYALRGTASLVLQGLDMIAVDIDILCDKETALACNKLLNKYLVEKVKYKKSDKFKSYYGKFRIKEIEVEIMGEWQIKDTSPKVNQSMAGKARWSKQFNASGEQRKKVTIRGKKVNVTTIETELLCFAKMGRWNAYHKIRRQFEKQSVGDKQQRLL